MFIEEALVASKQKRLPVSRKLTFNRTLFGARSTLLTILDDYPRLTGNFGIVRRVDLAPNR
jgi:hypothetical protein